MRPAAVRAAATRRHAVKAPSQPPTSSSRVSHQSFNHAGVAGQLTPPVKARQARGVSADSKRNSRRRSPETGSAPPGRSPASSAPSPRPADQPAARTAPRATTTPPKALGKTVRFRVVRLMTMGRTRPAGCSTRRYTCLKRASGGHSRAHQHHRRNQGHQPPGCRAQMPAAAGR